MQIATAFPLPIAYQNGVIVYLTALKYVSLVAKFIIIAALLRAAFLLDGDL